LWIISANNSVTNVQPLSLDPAIRIYPNPANDYLLVASANGTMGEGAACIYDIAGKLVQKQNLNFSGAAQEQAVFVGALDKGVYFIRVETAGGTSAKPFIKN
jgi:hypothetical protein